MACRLKASFRSNAGVPVADEAAAAVPFSVAAARVSAASAASAADAAVPSAGFSADQLFAVSSADVPGPGAVVASAVAGPAFDSVVVAVSDISGRSLDFLCSAADLAGSALANRSDGRSWADWHYSRWLWFRVVRR